MPNLSKVQEEAGKTVIPALVTSLNGETGAVNIVAGANVTVTPAGQNITITSKGYVLPFSYIVSVAGSTYTVEDQNGNMSSGASLSTLLNPLSGSIYMKKGAYTWDANYTPLANTTLILENGVSFTWGAYVCYINGYSNILVRSESQPQSGTPQAMFPLTLDNTNSGGVWGATFEGLLCYPIIFNCTTNNAFGHFHFVRCFCETVTQTGNYAHFPQPVDVEFDNCEFALYSDGQSFLKSSTQSPMGQTRFIGCSFYIGANNCSFFNNQAPSSQGQTTSVQFTDCNVVIASGKTGTIWYYGNPSSGATYIIDFEVNGVYLEDTSPITLLKSSGSISGQFIFKNINTAGLSQNTLMSISYSETQLTIKFEDIGADANSHSLNWVVGTFLGTAASALTVTCNRVAGVTYFNDTYGAIKAPATAGSSPYTFPYLPYKTIYVLTTIAGMTALTLDGQALFGGVFAVGQQILVGPMHPLIATWAATAPVFEIMTVE
jgi:hypothetical protein